MNRNFDFQMFDEQNTLQIPGIDSDIVAELAAEMPTPETETPAEEENQSAQVEETSESEEAEQEGAQEQGTEQGTEEEETATADADSDNKQVAGEPKTNVPYARFKEANERRKAAEAELAALKAKMQAKAVPEEVAPQQAQANAETSTQPDIMKAVAAEALRRAKAKLGLDDEAMANLEFADDLEAKTQFQLVVQQESAALMERARQISQERMAHERGVIETTERFTEFVNEFHALPDAVERWDYIANVKFLELPEQHQAVVREAFARLQNKKGTPQDYYLAKGYFDMASAEFTAKHKPQAVVPTVPAAVPNNTAAKVKAAQALPKAANVGGAAAKPNMGVEDIANILNKPGADALDEIPPDILKKILSGQPIG